MTNAARRMTIPKPVRSAMLMGRKRNGERLVRIRLKTRMEIPKHRSCQRSGGHFSINAMNFFLMDIGWLL
jgi:hypothetical protein